MDALSHFISSLFFFFFFNPCTSLFLIISVVPLMCLSSCIIFQYVSCLHVFFMYLLHALPGPLFISVSYSGSGFVFGFRLSSGYALTAGITIITLSLMAIFLVSRCRLRMHVPLATWWAPCQCHYTDSWALHLPCLWRKGGPAYVRAAYEATGGSGGTPPHFFAGLSLFWGRIRFIFIIPFGVV